MSVIIALKDNDRVQIVTTGTKYLGSFALSVQHPAEFKLKKFKNVYIAMSGNGNVIDSFERKVDFNSLSENLTSKELTRELLPYLLRILVQENYMDEKDEWDGLCDVTMLIVQGKRIWTISYGGVQEHALCAIIGSDQTPANSFVDSHWMNYASKRELGIEAMRFAIEFSALSDYPIIVGDSASTKVDIIDEEGNITSNELYDFNNEEEE